MTALRGIGNSEALASMMPAGLEQSMGTQKLVDLVTYLMSLKKDE